ncbi:MAG: hypothetical protein Q8K72_20700, partial [Acidimicrobiales bacterium]|nr:hypothetical protein [Acidimicrobiales bacterium]
GNLLDFRRAFLVFTTNAGATYDEKKAIGFGLSRPAENRAGGPVPRVTVEAVKADLLALLPHLQIIDVLGSSESGRQGTKRSSGRDGATTGTFDSSPTAVVLDEALTRPLEPGDDELGWLAQSGRVPLGYLGDPDKSARTFPLIDGVRYAVPGDRARVLADGSIELHGRDSVTINTGGEKVFAEEVEQALKLHPAVFDALVVGRPSDRWGQEVVAVVQLREGQDAADEDLRSAASAMVASYKLPKTFVRVDQVVRSPSGKPDYGWANRVAAADAPARATTGLAEGPRPS